jgi:hypothetical protein
VLCLYNGLSRRGDVPGVHSSLAFPVLNRRIEQLREERLNRAKTEIAERIRRVCTEMAPGDFDALVSDMAEVQIKYTLRRSTDLFPDGGGRREPS